MKAMKLSGVISIFLVFGFSLSCLRENGNLKKNLGNTVQVIDLFSPPDLELSALSMVASDVTYIPLSTNKGSIFNFIEKIRINNGRFFIMVYPIDIMCFNEVGRFLFKLDMKGEGPGEYTSIRDFDVSDDGKTLVLLSMDKIQYYAITDSGFSYSNSITLKQPYPSLIAFVSGTDNLLLSLSSSLGTEKSLNYLLDIYGDTLFFKHNGYQYQKMDNIFSSHDVIQYKSGAKVYFKEVWSDTVFSVSKESNSFNPSLIFDSHGTVAKTEFRSNPNYVINHKTDISEIAGISDVERYIIYYCLLKSERNLSLYDKKEKIKFGIDRNIFPVDDICGGPHFRFSTNDCASNGFWYSSVEAMTLKQYIQSDEFINAVPKDPQKKDQLKSMADSLNDIDNPVLVIVTPKK